MATTAKEVTWLYRHLGIPVQFNISYKMQLTRFWLSSDKNLSPRTGEHHLLHSLVFLYISMGQDFKLSNSRSNWTDGLHWYIHDVCSVASHAKGYQALPLLTVCHRRAGGEPGNEASVCCHAMIMREVYLWFTCWVCECRCVISRVYKQYCD